MHCVILSCLALLCNCFAYAVTKFSADPTVQMDLSTNNSTGTCFHIKYIDLDSSGGLANFNSVLNTTTYNYATFSDGQTLCSVK